jgi:hypothetical protein
MKYDISSQSVETPAKKFRRLLHSENGRVCPFLGFQHDKGTHAIFPTTMNFCHCRAEPLPTSLEQQSGYCLLESYVRCSRFLTRAHAEVNSAWPQPAPKDEPSELVRLAAMVLGVK